MLLVAPSALAYALLLPSLAAALVLTVVGLGLVGVLVLTGRGWGSMSRGLARGLLDEGVDDPPSFVRPRRFWRGLWAMLGDVDGWRALLFMLLAFPTAIAGWVTSITFMATGAGGLTYWYWYRFLPLQAATDGTWHRGAQLGTDWSADTPRRLWLVAAGVTGMAFSCLIMFAIIIATAATLGASGQTVSSAADAAKALAPIAGSWSTALFAVGFIGSGVLAVPVLAASGAAGMAGLTNKEWGLDRSPGRAPLFYVLFGAGIVAGTAMSLAGLNPISLLVLSAILNGIAAGPFLLVMMFISRDRRIMGSYANGRVAATLGWTTTVLMCVAGAYGIWFTVTGG